MRIPETQYAVQLTAPDKLILNKSKKIIPPGKHQVLAKVEAVGLCFSDLKLLKQFSSHPRKSEVISGIDQEILKHIPSYVPGDMPTVPGHEAVVTIRQIGEGVKNFKPGERYLVQADYRRLRTDQSNAAFGYNFEGALQQYVLMDERVITSPQGESFLIPLPKHLSASAAALVEPWACVEDAYVCAQRRCLKENGKLLVAAEADIDEDALINLLKSGPKPSEITWLGDTPLPKQPDMPIQKCADISLTEDSYYDDIIYFGSRARTIEKLFAKIAPQGLFNIVLCGGKIDKDIVTPVGKVHYGGIRIIGTPGFDPAEAISYIPKTAQIRTGDSVNIVGAAGPMGLMHVARNICLETEGVSVFAGDLDDKRMAALTKIADPLAKKNNVVYEPYNPAGDSIHRAFDYTALLVPAGKLVAEAVRSSREKGIINIFAGIPATVTAPIDIDSYIRKQLYFVGTSGSTLDDMKKVLKKLVSGRLDTNVSVAAVCGLESAPEGIAAVENRSIAGKIIVYPSCRNLPLMTLKTIAEKMPEVAACFSDGLWTAEAENLLLKKYRCEGEK